MALILRPRSKLLLSVTLFVLQLTCVFMKQARKDDYYFEYIMDIFENGGITAVKYFLNKDLNDWKDIEINIAIIGNSGTGKSSFINAILGLTADDKGAAAVGVTETTKNITQYQHPSNSQLVLWDLPGVGTPTYKRKQFFDQVNVNQFDYFIIITSDRFRDDDLWLATQMNAKDRLFYFVRSKVGQDIVNNKKSHPNTHSDTAMLDQIRKDCELNLQSIALNKGLTVYLIDSYEPEKYDFDLFTSKVIEDAPEKKREAMILYMKVLTESVILAKKEMLSERIYSMSLLSALAGALPVPLLDSATDIGIVLEEAEFYRNQFGLSDELLNVYAKRSYKSIEQLEIYLNLTSRIITMSTKGLLSYFTKKGLKTAVTLSSAKYLKYLLPMFGSIASAGASYTLTSWCLHDLLDVMAEDAIKINEHITSV